MDNTRPIGVFDSGIGGLTVVRALRELLPRENIVYLGDTARVPYGTKSPETVVRYARACTNFLKKHDIKLLVVACNTASAHALSTLQQENGLPILGVIEPGARLATAATSTGHIGVFATRGTVASQAYHRAVTGHKNTATITAVACPLFVPLVEEGIVQGSIAEAIVKEYVETLASADGEIDTVILGCTHYPPLTSRIRSYGEKRFRRPLQMINSGTSVAEEVQSLLVDQQGESSKTRQGTLRIMFTDACRIQELAPLLLGEKISSYDIVDL